MLSQEFIANLVGLEEFDVLDAELEEEDGAVIFHVEPAWEAALCPDCGRASGSVLEYVPRLTRGLSVCGRFSYLSFEQRRFRLCSELYGATVWDFCPRGRLHCALRTIRGRASETKRHQGGGRKRMPELGCSARGPERNRSRNKPAVSCRHGYGWRQVSARLNNFLGTLERWQGCILNCFAERASNGFAQGLNNALKLLKRQAYGFRNFAHFRLRVFLLHAFP